jgi:hypothetical protein
MIAVPVPDTEHANRHVMLANMASDVSNSSTGFFPRTPDSDWRRAHTELERLARSRARLDSEEGYWLVRASRARVHAELGYGSFSEYIERLFGYEPRWTKEKLRVGEALEALPALSRALSGGALSWSAVRELTRVATAETEIEWLEAARGKTLREIEKQVSGRRPGDRPGDTTRPEAVRHVLRFEVCTETLAVVREAMAKLRRDSGSALDDDAALLLMARQVLGGPTDEGRSSYQVLMTVCERCGRAQEQAGSELVDVDPSAVEMASCDAQRVGARGADGEGDVRTEPDSATHVGGNDWSRAEPSSKTHVGRDRGLQVSRTADTRAGKPLPRAVQDVPPAVRRWVMRRDGGCCVVPGCRHAVFVDVHHLSPRAEGGDHDHDGLLVLCAAHHRAVHRGQLVVEGRVSTGLVFRHADGRRYGEPVGVVAAETWAKAFRALRSMGFSETETRRALERTRARVSEVGESLSAEHVLRMALGVLTERRGTTTIVRGSAFPVRTTGGLEHGRARPPYSAHRCTTTLPDKLQTMPG